MDDQVFFKTIAGAITGTITGNNAGMDELVGKQYAHRIEAHRGNTQMSIQNALISAYSVVERLVGEEYMQDLAHVFVQKYPPKSASLTLYGDEFPAFLAEFEPVQKELPWLPAVAKLDQIWFAAYEAKDEPHLTAKDLENNAPQQLPILAPGLHASVQVLRFKIPAYSIWRTNKQDKDIIPVDIKSGDEWTVFWRHKNTVHHEAITQAQYVFLNNIEAGLNFATSYAEACRFDRGFNLQQQSSHWLSVGMFRGRPS